LLSPNHMLVREDSSSDAKIIEVVLMLDDAGSSSAGAGEFLPTGDPTEAIIADEQLDPNGEQALDAGTIGTGIANGAGGTQVERGINKLRDSMRELEAQKNRNGQPDNGTVRLDPPANGFDPQYEENSEQTNPQ